MISWHSKNPIYLVLFQLNQVNHFPQFNYFNAMKTNKYVYFVAFSFVFIAFQMIYLFIKKKS